MPSSDSEVSGLTFLIFCFFMVIWLAKSTDTKRSCDISIEASSKQQFITQANDRNVKLLYTRLLFVNEPNTDRFSFGDDISTIYDPLGWAWTKSDQGKKILSLPNDYYILSLTTLARETDSVELRVISKPAGCFGRQYGHHQLKYVLNMLSETAKAVSSDSLVCHRFVHDPIKSSIKIMYQSTFATRLPIIQYRCCPVYNPDIGCSVVIVPNAALSLILWTIWFVSCVVAFLTPLLITYLPNESTETRLYDSDITLRYEFDFPESHINDVPKPEEEPAKSNVLNRAEINEDDYMNFDTSTPLTALLLSEARLLLAKVNPRVLRFLFFAIHVPAVLIFSLLSYSLLLKHEVDLQKQAEIKTDFVQMCLNPDIFLICQMVAYVVSCLMLSVPGNIDDVVDESLILIGDLQYESSCCFICTAMKHTPSEEVAGVQLLYDNIWRHLKYLSTSHFWELLYSVSSFPSRWLLHYFRTGERLRIAEIWQPEQAAANHDDGFSCWDVISVSLWLLLSPLWLIAFFTVTSVIICFIIPIGYFLACICFIPLVLLTQKFGNSIYTWLCFFVCFCTNILSALFFVQMMTFSWHFVLKMVSFTFMGLFAGFVYYNSFLAFAFGLYYYVKGSIWDLNDKYVKLKVLLFDECEKQQKDLGDAPILFIKNKKTEMPMIPKELYEIVCNKHIPLKKTISSSILQLVMIIFFVTFAFVSVVAVGKSTNLPSITEAILTALISTLPKMIRNYKHAGWSLFKEKKKLYSVEVIVSQCARKHKNLLGIQHWNQ